jgi:acetyl-CoA C-acetyltransferase
MPTASRSIDVAASQEDAFALITDPGRFGEWLSLHDSWPGGTPDGMAEGDQFVQTLRIMGMPADVNWTVARYEAPSRVVLEGHGPMGAKLQTTMTAASNGAATTVSYDAEFAGGGIQGPMGDMVTKKAGEELETSLSRLKALAG